MQNTKKPVEFYNEEDAANYLGISISHLHHLLDEHIFNDGSGRPENLTFTNSELALLGFWRRVEPVDNVLRMPRRN